MAKPSIPTMTSVAKTNGNRSPNGMNFEGMRKQGRGRKKAMRSAVPKKSKGTHISMLGMSNMNVKTNKTNQLNQSNPPFSLTPNASKPQPNVEAAKQPLSMIP